EGPGRASGAGRRCWTKPLAAGAGPVLSCLPYDHGLGHSQEYAQRGGIPGVRCAGEPASFSLRFLFCNPMKTVRRVVPCAPTPAYTKHPQYRRTKRHKLSEGSGILKEISGGSPLFTEDSRYFRYSTRTTSMLMRPSTRTTGSRGVR